MPYMRRMAATSPIHMCVMRDITEMLNEWNSELVWMTQTMAGVTKYHKVVNT